MRPRTIRPGSKAGLARSNAQLLDALRVATAERELWEKRANAERRGHEDASRKLDEHVSDLGRLRMWQLHLEMDHGGSGETTLCARIRLSRGMMYCPTQSFCRTIAEQLVHMLEHSPEFNQEALRVGSGRFSL